jgi:hypothetical protein
VKYLHELSLWAATQYQVGKMSLQDRKTSLQDRLSEDRGEGAVSTAVIVAIVAAAAVILGGAITVFVNRWITRLNTSCPPGGCG